MLLKRGEGGGAFQLEYTTIDRKYIGLSIFLTTDNYKIFTHFLINQHGKEIMLPSLEHSYYFKGIKNTFLYEIDTKTQLYYLNDIMR